MWSWPAAASWAPAARSTRARSCPRTRSCTAQAASGACRARSRRSVLHRCFVCEFNSADWCNQRVGRLFSSRSLRLCSSTSSWRFCPTTTTWRRRWREAARPWGTDVEESNVRHTPTRRHHELSHFPQFALAAQFSVFPYCLIKLPLASKKFSRSTFLPSGAFQETFGAQRNTFPEFKGVFTCLPLSGALTAIILLHIWLHL